MASCATSSAGRVDSVVRGIEYCMFTADSPFARPAPPVNLPGRAMGARRSQDSKRLGSSLLKSSQRMGYWEASSSTLEPTTFW